jgi:ABC-type bacteriocin/lantibiotic exporter with double-glycine peptidase domain
MKFEIFTTYRQLDAMDCGPTCLKIIFKYYGKQISLEGLKKAFQIGTTGVSLLGISEAAEKYGFRTIKMPKDKIGDTTACVAEGQHFISGKRMVIN